MAFRSESALIIRPLLLILQLQRQHVTRIDANYLLNIGYSTCCGKLLNTTLNIS